VAPGVKPAILNPPPEPEEVLVGAAGLKPENAGATFAGDGTAASFDLAPNKPDAVGANPVALGVPTGFGAEKRFEAGEAVVALLLADLGTNNDPNGLAFGVSLPDTAGDPGNAAVFLAGLFSAD